MPISGLFTAPSGVDGLVLSTFVSGSNFVSGWPATQVMIEETSLASKSGESSCSTPPEAKSPRGSQVTTLYPSARNGFRPGTRPKTVVSWLGSVYPAVARLGPLRMVGATCPFFRPRAGK